MLQCVVWGCFSGASFISIITEWFCRIFPPYLQLDFCMRWGEDVWCTQNASQKRALGSTRQWVRRCVSFCTCHHPSAAADPQPVQRLAWQTKVPFSAGTPSHGWWHAAHERLSVSRLGWCTRIRWHCDKRESNLSCVRSINLKTAELFLEIWLWKSACDPARKSFSGA